MAINPKNLTAQLAYRASGNPPSTLPDAAISNFFPGLEFDLRSLWKHIFEGVELHESGIGGGGHVVLAVSAGSPAAIAGVAAGHRLRSVDGRDVEAVQATDEGPRRGVRRWSSSTLSPKSPANRVRPRDACFLPRTAHCET